MRILALAVILAFSTACTLMPSDAPAFAPAPPPLHGLSNVYIYRLNAYPVLHNPTIKVDGFDVIDPPEKAYTVIQLSPGEHDVEVNWSWLAGWPDLKFRIKVTGGEPYYLRVGGEVFETRVTSVLRNAAEPELAACCRYVAPRKRP